MIVFVDESGVSASSDAASDHFVVAGVAVRDRNLHRVLPYLENLRRDINRPSGSISWKDIRGHSQRLHCVQVINEVDWIRTISVVICKRHLSPSEMNAEHRYRWTLRLLLERISWLAEKHREQAHVVVSHVRGFEPETLAEYEAALRSTDTEIKWAWLDPDGCEVVESASREELQLADIVASATACAFEPDTYGNVEQRYLREMRSPIWDNDGGRITTYGLKLHPARVLKLPIYAFVEQF